MLIVWYTKFPQERYIGRQAGQDQTSLGRRVNGLLQWGHGVRGAPSLGGGRGGALGFIRELSPEMALSTTSKAVPFFPY